MEITDRDVWVVAITLCVLCAGAWIGTALIVPADWLFR